MPKPNYAAWDLISELDPFKAACLICDIQPISEYSEEPVPAHVYALCDELKNPKLGPKPDRTTGGPGSGGTHYPELGLSLPEIDPPLKIFFRPETLRTWCEARRLTPPAFFPEARRPAEKRSAPHGNAERFAQKREEVLGAALACLATWPPEKVTGVAIAQLIDEKAPLFWREGSPPLSRDGMERLIRDWLRKTEKTAGD